MARFVDPDSSRAKIDALVEAWRDDCLVGSGSILFDERQVYLGWQGARA